VSEKSLLTMEQLKARAIRFFDRYGSDLSQIRQLLEIRLSHLALAYTIEHNLPPEAIVVTTRVKSVQSFLALHEVVWVKSKNQLYLVNERQAFIPTDTWH